jgi:TatD DNase family protein
MIDSHCHIAGAEFVADLDAVVARAATAGVTGALVILGADDEVEIAQAEQVRRAWSACRFAVGVHPHHAHRFAGDPDEAARLVERRLDSLPLARAVGEIGLDYHYDFSPPANQQAVFRVQLAVARARGLPVVIHTREAESDTLQILGEGGQVDTAGVFHCFSGDAAAAARALATGYSVSIPGIVSFPKAVELRAAVAGIPLDRLLVETDSPYLAPTPFRGKRNEPAHVARVVDVIAEARGMSAADVGEITAANFARLFRP